jgi:integrase
MSERLAERGTVVEIVLLAVLALDPDARQGELFALRRSDVDLKNRTITIRRSVRYANDGRLMVTETKTGRDRMVPISLRSANALRSHFKAHMASEYVFTEPQTGQPLRKENLIRRSFRPLLRRTWLTPIRFHDPPGTARLPDCSSRAFIQRSSRTGSVTVDHGDARHVLARDPEP